MIYNFDNFISWLFPWEGTTYEHDPDDAGGETKFGIDKASHPNEDIKNLTAARAKEIYKSEYWNKVCADLLPPKINWIVTDIAVNNGVFRASKWLQEYVGAKVDGRIGSKTLAAVSSFCHDHNGEETLRQLLLERREAFYQSIARGTQRKFLRGWLNRNESLRNVTSGEIELEGKLKEQPTV